MNYLIAGITGLLLVLSFAPVNLFPLAWIALVPFILRLTMVSSKDSFRMGFAMGMVYFFGTTYWIYNSMHDYGGMGLVSSLIIVTALAAYLALYPAVFSYIFSFVMGRSQVLPALAVAPALWVSLEYARSYLLTGFPWSILGYSQWNFLPAIQISDLTGVYGVSFLVVAVNAAIADVFILKRRTREMPLLPLWQAGLAYALFLFLIAFTGLYANYRLAQQPAGKPLKASVVQGDIDQGRKWDPAYRAKVFKTYEDLSRGAAFQAPDLIVWPEAALPFPFDLNTPDGKELKAFETSLKSPLLLGAVREETPGSDIYANSAELLNYGENTYTYDKIHLVPFGEYVPLERVLFFVNKLSGAIGSYQPGDDYTRGEIKQGEFAVPICYEIAFPGLVRKFFKDGGDFMVTITNDAWFGRSAGPYQHFAMAVLRAVENRKPVIRAANTGISGFINSHGRVIARTKLMERRTLTAELVTDPTRTVYSRYGDLFSYLCILGTFFLLVFSFEGKE